MNQNRLEQEEIRRQSIAANKEESKPVIAELAQAGFDIEWISELYAKGHNYKKAIPILIKWLPLVERRDVKGSIVSALSVPWAKKTEASRVLIEEFKKDNADPFLKWEIGNALAVTADDEVLPEIRELILDTSHGKAREMLVVALGNMRAADVEDLLIDLLRDEQLDGHAVVALRKLKSQKACPEIEKLLSHKRTWIRNEAKKALKKIGCSRDPAAG